MCLFHLMVKNNCMFAGHICPAATIDRKWTACQTPHAEYVKLFKADAVKEGLKRKLDAGDNKQQKTENKAKSFDSSVTSKLSNKSKKDQIRMDCTLCRAELLNPIYTNNEQLGLLSSCIDVNCPLKVHQHPPVVPGFLQLHFSYTYVVSYCTYALCLYIL